MQMSKSATNNLLIGILVIIVVLFGYYFYAMKTRPTDSTQEPHVVVSLEDHVRGGATAPVTLVEFGDFQCPACGAYEPLVRQVQATQGNNMRLVFRHFPLTQLHPNALLAAKFSEAASIQGKFWEMHDALYDNQKEWEGSLAAQDLFTKYGAKIGLDVTKLVNDANSQAVEDKILAQYKEGVKLGVQGTPTFFVNGVKIDNPQSIEAFNKLITDAKAKK